MSPRFTPKPKEYPTSLALRDAYNDFIVSRQSMQCTEATLAFYRNTALKFLLWAEKHGVTTLREVTARLVREYLAELAAKGRLDTTCNAHARAIRTLLLFLHVEGYIPEVVKFAMPRLSKKRLPILNADQLQQVIKACNVRDKAIILFMADSGLRRSEILNLNWGDLNMENGLVRVTRGKGKKDRSAVVGVVVRQAVLKYRQTVPYEDHMPLFWSRTGDRLTGTGILLIFRRLSKRTGIHVTPHALRRTFTVLALRADMDVLHIQALLGHADLTMVYHYAQMVDDDLLDAHHKHSPVDNLE